MKIVEVSIESLCEMSGEQLRLRGQVTELQQKGTTLELERRKFKHLSEEQAEWIKWLEGRVAFLERGDADAG